MHRREFPLTEYAAHIKHYMHWRYGLDSQKAVIDVLDQPRDCGEKAEADRAGNGGCDVKMRCVGCAREKGCLSSQKGKHNCRFETKKQLSTI